MMRKSLSVLCLCLAILTPVFTFAAEGTDAPTIRFLPAGTQEVGLSAGWMMNHRLTGDHVSKPQGPAVIPSWGILLNDAPGDRWYHGQVSIGAEIPYIVTTRPIMSYGVGFTPRIKYTLTMSPQLRPYVEFGGGPYWTTLGQRVPEQGTKFNFIVHAGFGVSWFLTSQTAITASYRFHHISNAGIRYPNLGLNSSLPMSGFSFYF